MPKTRHSARRSSVSRLKPGKPAASANRRNGRSNQLRIIGGDWRGRKLPFPDGEGLRPTGDRMREVLFNWLSFELYGRRVLDLFAGSGALGLEALSRGAKQAVFLDTHPGVVRQIRENLLALSCTTAEVVQADALSWLDQSQQGFDLVFLDPPFGQGLLSPVCHALQRSACLNEGALIYLEAEKGFDFNGMPEHWQLQKEKRSGQVICRLYSV